MMSSQNGCTWIDRLETCLNACSLETLYAPVKNGVYPLVIGCYQLNEAQQNDGSEGDNEEGKGDTGKASRSGELMLHCIDKELVFGAVGGETLRKCRKVQILPTDSGVLDGKWLQSGQFHISNNHHYMYATANASGAINIYKLCDEGADEDDDSSNGIQLTHECASKSDVDTDGLALSLSWDESKYKNKQNSDIIDTNNEILTRVVSSYSKGSLAVHNVNCSSGVIQLEEMQRWNAHTLFGCAAEVWTVCFANNQHYNTYADTVISGGDDCKMKTWDLRMFQKPTSVRTDFEAGVTTASYHPSLEHIFAVGSYDEGVRIWDMRKISARSEPLANINVGGGVWRIKWHPKDVNRMLVGAMHGGCRLVEVSGIQSSSTDDFDVNACVTEEFTAHDSMAYGADWIYCENQSFEAAASCSFYDRQAFIW